MSPLAVASGFSCFLAINQEDTVLQVGRTYSFKTLTFYYIGTVTKMYPTHAEISDATEVFETGPNAAYYAGNIANHERIPDGALVPLNGTLITPWEHVIR